MSDVILGGGNEFFLEMDLTGPVDKNVLLRALEEMGFSNVLLEDTSLKSLKTKIGAAMTMMRARAAVPAPPRRTAPTPARRATPTPTPVRQAPSPLRIVASAAPVRRASVPLQTPASLPVSIPGRMSSLSLVPSSMPAPPGSEAELPILIPVPVPVPVPISPPIATSLATPPLSTPPAAPPSPPSKGGGGGGGGGDGGGGGNGTEKKRGSEEGEEGNGGEPQDEEQEESAPEEEEGDEGKEQESDAVEGVPSNRIRFVAMPGRDLVLAAIPRGRWTLVWPLGISALTPVQVVPRRSVPLVQGQMYDARFLSTPASKKEIRAYLERMGFDLALGPFLLRRHIRHPALGGDLSDWIVRGSWRGPSMKLEDGGYGSILFEQISNAFA